MLRCWPRCDEFLNSKAKKPLGPRFVWSKQERQALNLNATFLSCVVTSISPAMLLFLASGWIFQLPSRSLKSYISDKIIIFNVSITITMFPCILSFWDNFTHIATRVFGISLLTLTDHLCNRISGLSSGERRELVSMKINLNPSQCLCGRRLMNVRASETPEWSQFPFSFEAWLLDQNHQHKQQIQYFNVCKMTYLTRTRFVSCDINQPKKRIHFLTELLTK